jgi:hypothetical protein
MTSTHCDDFLILVEFYIVHIVCISFLFCVVIARVNNCVDLKQAKFTNMN